MRTDPLLQPILTIRWKAADDPITATYVVKNKSPSNQTCQTATHLPDPGFEEFVTSPTVVVFTPGQQGDAITCRKVDHSLKLKGRHITRMNYCKYLVITGVTAVVCAGIGVGLLFHPYMWAGEPLSKRASVVTIMSLIGVPIAYFAKQNQKEKERKRNEDEERYRASQNIYRELQDALEGLDRNLYRDDALSFRTKDNREIFFMNRNLNHDFYDSLVFSGKINFLRPELQQHIQNIFRQIKTHNEFLALARKMRDETPDAVIPEKSYGYYEWMDENEQKLLEDIPKMQKKLTDDFGVSPS